MTTLSSKASSLAILNLFEAANEDEQTDIIRRVSDLTEQVMVNLPGFISANLHRSISSSLTLPDQFFVANYAQWQTAANITTMLQDPTALTHRKEITSHYRSTGTLLRLVSQYSPENASSTILSKECVTVLNLFQAENEEEQDVILQYLTEITKKIMMYRTGFLSANLHRSINSSLPPANTFFVMNYAQWKTVEDFMAMRQDPDVLKHIQETASRYSRTRALFRLVSSFHA